MTTIVNLFAGPGAGKSTVAHGLCFELKKWGYNAEFVQEAAKPYAYEYEYFTAVDEIKILSQQLQNEVAFYQTDVDFVICESPLELQAYYWWRGHQDFSVIDFVRKLRSEIQIQHGPFIQQYDLFLERDESHFQQSGRVHDLAQSIEIDSEIIEFLGTPLTSVSTVDILAIVQKVRDKHENRDQ